MKTAEIRQKLVNYMKVADDKKVKAIYTLFEEEIEQEEMEYREDFKVELEKRQVHYRSGGKMVSGTEVNKQVNKMLRAAKQK